MFSPYRVVENKVGINAAVKGGIDASLHCFNSPLLEGPCYQHYHTCQHYHAPNYYPIFCGTFLVWQLDYEAGWVENSQLRWKLVTAGADCSAINTLPANSSPGMLFRARLILDLFCLDDFLLEYRANWICTYNELYNILSLSWYCYPSVKQTAKTGPEQGP